MPADTPPQPPRRVIGIMGGSFNPVHVGHLMLASYIAQHAGLDEVWLVVSPLNPLKAGSTDIIADTDRLAMLRLATEGSSLLKASDIEMHLPLPSYTVNTLDSLAAAHPDCRFRLIIGSDNWAVFDRWKDCERLISRYDIIVYPRPGYPVDKDADQRVTVIDAPRFDISSTFIRSELAAGHDMNYFLPTGVYNYILRHNLYRQH